MRNRPAGLLAAVALMALASSCSAAPSAPGSAASASASSGPPGSWSAGGSSDASRNAGLPDLQEIGAAGVQRRTVTGGPDRLVLAGGSAWVTTAGGLTRLDGVTGVPRGTISLGSPVCAAMDVGFRSVWVPLCGTPAVLRIEEFTGQVQARIGLPVAGLRDGSSLAAGAGRIWALSSGRAQLVAIDPEKDLVAHVFAAPANASAVRAAYGSLWVTAAVDGLLYRLDPATAKVRATIAVGRGAGPLAVGEGGVWVLDETDGTVSHVDPVSGLVDAVIPVSGGTITDGDIAVGGGSVWVRVADALVSRVDPRAGAVTTRYGPASGAGGVAADPSAAWVSAPDVDTLWRLPLG